MDSLMLGLVCIAIVIACAYVVTRKSDNDQNKSQQTPQPSITDPRTVLTVLVKDHGSSSSIEIYGKNVQNVAYAAGYLTAIAAKSCPDGFEKGLEYIQDDAMNFAAGKCGF